MAMRLNSGMRQRRRTDSSSLQARASSGESEGRFAGPADDWPEAPAEGMMVSDAVGITAAPPAGYSPFVPAASFSFRMSMIDSTSPSSRDRRATPASLTMLEKIEGGSNRSLEFGTMTKS